MVPLAVAVIVLLPMVVVGGEAVSLTADRYGVGPAVTSLIPTLPGGQNISQDRAVAIAEPYASELSQRPAVYRSARAYDIADACDPEDPFGDVECDYSGPVWAVEFLIFSSHGGLSQIVVVLDADTGEVLYTEQ
jgi:hypothetical protein